jgi:iron complex outermembrane receptor protein
VGVEGRKEILNSTNLGLRERTLGGVFLEHRIEFLQGFDLRAGMYSNYFDQYRWKHFPGIELGYQINKASRIYSNYGTSFRIPSFTELYYEDPSNLSNPNLLPEEAQSFEIGWKYEQKKVVSELVFFSRSSQNLIDWNRNPSAISPNPNRWMPRNISSVNFLGFETFLSYQPEFKSGEFILKNISISYSYIDASLDQAPNVESRYALNALKNQIVGGFQLEFLKKTELNIKTRYLERMAMDPYFLLDAKLNYNRMKALGFFGEVTNITNTEYLEAGFVQMPGRWFKIGILLNL